MQYRTLGRTGLRVSEISLGTVQFGLPYGIPNAQGELPMLSEAESLTLLHQAFAQGVNFLDTARDYGMSEAIIGKALHHESQDVIVATKISALSETMSDGEIRQAITTSIDASRQALGRTTLDLIQIHNATRALLNRPVVYETLQAAQARQHVRFLGVSTYGVEDPQFALEQGHWDTVQMEFNLFNQQVQRLFDQMAHHQTGVIIRSAMLKGAMVTDPIPKSLQPLVPRVQALQQQFSHTGLKLPQIALGFVLSHPAVSTVLTGVLTPDQLMENCRCSDLPRWSAQQLQSVQPFDMGTSTLTDPRQWGF